MVWKKLLGLGTLDWINTYKRGFIRGIAYYNIYFKTEGEHQLIIVLYVDEIMFGGRHDKMCQEFSQDMHKDFEMLVLGEIYFFLRLHISQLNKGIFISQNKYIKEMLQNFRMK